MNKNYRYIDFGADYFKYAAILLSILSVVLSSGLERSIGQLASVLVVIALLFVTGLVLYIYRKRNLDSLVRDYPEYLRTMSVTENINSSAPDEMQMYASMIAQKMEGVTILRPLKERDLSVLTRLYPMPEDHKDYSRYWPIGQGASGKSFKSRKIITVDIPQDVNKYVELLTQNFGFKSIDRRLMKLPSYKSLVCVPVIMEDNTIWGVINFELNAMPDDVDKESMKAIADLISKQQVSANGTD